MALLLPCRHISVAERAGVPTWPFLGEATKHTVHVPKPLCNRLPLMLRRSLDGNMEVGLPILGAASGFVLLAENGVVVHLHGRVRILVHGYEELTEGHASEVVGGFAARMLVAVTGVREGTHVDTQPLFPSVRKS